MRRPGTSHLVTSLAASLLAIGASLSSPLEAQNLCFVCNQTRPFGDCVIQTADYPGELPGSAAVVPHEDITYLVVADLFAGMSFRYQPAIAAGVIDTDSMEIFASPGGSRTTSGIAYNPDEAAVYWGVHAVDDDGGLPPNPRLMKSTTDLVPTSSWEESPEIDLVDLANRLGLPTVGSLGGITYHVARQKFWGVDIVNDIYFEFGLDGELSVEMVGDEERVVHFRSPNSTAVDYSDRSYAFGNGITYFEDDGEAYFDITVGDLADGEVTVVERVFAFADDTRPVPVNIGDPSGLYYRIEDAFGEHDFLTGLVHWTDTCGDGENAELLLDLGSLDAGPKMQFVSTDTPAPATRGVSTMTCESAADNSVTVRWTLFEDVQSLSIDRVDLATEEASAVLSLPPEGSPPGTLVPAGMEELVESLPDGSYEYLISVTTTTGVDVAPRSCQVTVGLGSTVGSTSFATTSRPDDLDPFAMTWIPPIERLLVVDVTTGNGHTYDEDLALQTTIDSALTSEFIAVGVAWAPGDAGGELVWIARHENGSDHFLQRTTLEVSDGELVGTELIGSPIKIAAPVDLPRQVLADAAYDAERQQFWIADRRNGIALAMYREDLSIGAFNGLRIVNPEGLEGVVGGGIAVVESTATSLVLDWTVGGGDTADLLTRVSYTRMVDMDDVETIEEPGTEMFTVQLTPSTGAGLFGGLARVSNGQGHEYIVSLDSAQIFQLNLAASVAGGAFVRGDANADERVNISDPSFILQHLFRGGAAPVCSDAADVNDDEVLDTSDAVYIFAHLFLGGNAPPAPYPTCGFDFDEGLTCDQDICVP